jgi:EmrB/QacA subfamily drug resistance transporter
VNPLDGDGPSTPRPTASRTPARPAPAARTGSGGVLLAMCLGLMLTMLNSTLVNVVMPAIGTSLHASVTGLQWVADVYTLTYASLLLPGGALGNRLGRRTAFLGGIVVFMVGSLSCALAPDLPVLLAARVVQALGVAVMLPQTLSILVHEYGEPAARSRAIGVWAGVASLALAAGPVLGGVVITVSDWRTGFYVTLLLAAVALGLGHRVIPRSRHGRPASGPAVDWSGGALGVLWLAALVYGLIEAGDRGWGSPTIVASFVVAAAGAVAFLVTQRRLARRGRTPLMPLHLWRAPGFVAANAAGLVYFFTLFGILFYYSLYLEGQQGRSPLATGLLFLPMTVCMAALAPVAGRLMARVGTRATLTGGLLVAAVGCLALAVQSGHAGPVDLGWRLCLVGVGSGLMSATMSNAAVSSVPATHSGTASAVHNTCRQIGSTLGVALLGVVLHARQQAALARPLTALAATARTAVADAARAGRADPGQAARLPAGVRRSIDAAAHAGYTSGLHTAMLLAGLALVASAGTAAALLGRRPNASAGS